MPNLSVQELKQQRDFKVTLHDHILYKNAPGARHRSDELLAEIEALSKQVAEFHQ